MKPTLIILPGWGGSTETWKDFIALAETEFQVVCIDLPCFGTEPCPSSVWGVEEYTAFVVTKIKAITEQPVMLLGHSFGGQIASSVAATHPDMVKKLILTGAAALRPKRSLRRGLFFLIAKCGKLLFKLPIIGRFDALAKKVLYKGTDSPDYGETSGIKRDIFRKIIRQDLRHLLPSISVPTLLVWGDQDSYVPLRMGKKINTLIPKSKLLVIKGGRHGLHLMQTDTLFNVVRSFVFE